MLYENIKTGAVIDSPCAVSGENWRLIEEAAEEPKIALEDMTVAELKAYAEEQGVDLEGAKKKADIIALIRR